MPVSQSDDPRQDMQRIDAPPQGAFQNFAQLLAAIEGGSLNADATDGMHRLTRELHDMMLLGRAASGSITVKIRFKADRGLIETTADIGVKHPPTIRGRTMLYVANGAYLSKRDPNQPDLPFRTVDGPVPELRSAD